MSTSIKDITETGSASDGLIRVSFVWKKDEYIDEEQSDGTVQKKKFNTVDHPYTVHIVRDLSYGATERILTAASTPSISLGATIVSEAVRFGEAGKEKMDYQTASCLKTSLVLALRAQVDKYHKGVTAPADENESEATEEGDAKKPS